jgi:hypothetical protein
MPIATSSEPSAPNAPESVAISRSGTMVASTCPASVVTRATCTSFSIARTARRTAGATACGSMPVRSANVPGGRWSCNASR